MDRIDEMAALYEDLICKVQGVFSARVKIDDADGEIIECHVLADKTRNVKQLVRDVQSALMAKFHVDLDYRLISVAQVDNLDNMITSSRPDAPAAAEPKAELPRALLRSFMMGYEGSNIKATVTITVGESTYTGEASGNSGTSSRFKILAQAAINAVNYNVNQNMTLSVLDVQKFTINAQSAYSVAVYYRLKGREETLLGAAMIHDDENMAVVKASLDALNRRLFLSPA